MSGETQDVGLAGYLADLSSVIRDYLSSQTDVSSPSFHATALASRLAARVAAERERANTAEATLRTVLDVFYEKGHPGRPCIRTGWIPVETVAKWRAALDTPREDQP